MRRRELMLLLGGAMTAARALCAQQKAMPVIGYLGVAAPGPYDPRMAAFHQGLSETGYVEGQNVAIEYRWAEGRYDRLPALAADLVSRKVDVIVASGGAPPARAAKNATSTFARRLTPVRLPPGRAKLATRPNSTASPPVAKMIGIELMPKRIELLSELVPQAKVIALLVNPSPPTADDLQEAARAKGCSSIS